MMSGATVSRIDLSKPTGFNGFTAHDLYSDMGNVLHPGTVFVNVFFTLSTR